MVRHFPTPHKIVLQQNTLWYQQEKNAREGGVLNGMGGPGQPQKKEEPSPNLIHKNLENKRYNRRGGCLYRPSQAKPRQKPL